MLGTQKNCLNETLNVFADRSKTVLLWIICVQGSHRLEKYLNIQDCLEKSLKIKFALKST